MRRRRQPTRTLAERELMATMTGGNVPPAEGPEPRSSAIAVPEVTFVIGFLLAVLGIALWSLPIGVTVLGAGLILAGWWLA